MSNHTDKLKLGFLILCLAFYLALMFASFTSAADGADVTYINNSTFTSTPESMTNLGGIITTVTLDVTYQEGAWKAYVGNITGILVLRDVDGWSIYEWAMNSSTMSGFIFVSRSGTVDWDDVVCANSSNVASEQTFFGMSSSDTYSINNTFNYSTHAAMDMSGPSNIGASSCQCTATWVNGSAQVVDATADFQELLLYDRTNLNFVYGTFISQDSWGFDNNESVNGTNHTYDFQVIVAEDRGAAAGEAYYFYADIS